MESFFFKENQFNLSFESYTTWLPSYQRNNKSKHSKNLGCFPCCRFGGHVPSFCGRSITIVLKAPISFYEKSVQIVAAAEFTTAKTPKRKYGEIITLSERNMLETTHTDNDHFIYGLSLVENIEKNSFQEFFEKKFEFNRSLKGWHYGFVGSKKTRNDFHKFCCYVFDSSQFFFIEILSKC